MSERLGLATFEVRVRQTLTARRVALQFLAKLLMDKEVVTAESLRARLGDGPITCS